MEILIKARSCCHKDHHKGNKETFSVVIREAPIFPNYCMENGEICLVRLAWSISVVFDLISLCIERHPVLQLYTHVRMKVKHLYYNYEIYPLSPLKPRSLALIEQYLPNISDPVSSVHQSFMWFLWLNWRKSTFYPVTAPNDSKCWPIVTSSIQEPVASNCDVTMTDCSRVVAMDAFLAYFVTPCFNTGHR